MWNSGSITKSTVDREPLPAGSVQETDYYTDTLFWFGNDTALINGMKHFYQETGVQPYLYITDTVNGSRNPSSSQMEEFAGSLYDELFQDEAHLLLVFQDADGHYTDWVITGSQAKQVVDDEAVNILLDYVFMYPLGMGMFGAAFATGLAPVISLAVLSLHFIKGPRRILPRVSLPGYRALLDCGRLGGASFVNEISSGVVLFVFNRVILIISGETGVAAYGVVANLALVAMSIFTGLCQGSQPLISRFHGQGDDHREKTVRRYALVSSFVLGSAVAMLALCFPAQLTALFNSAGDAQLAQIAERGIRLYFLGFPLAGINLVVAICLAASEHGTFSFTLALARGCVVILPVTLLLSSIWGMDGVWLSFPVTEAITLVYAFVLLRITKKPASQNLPNHRRIS